MNTTQSNPPARKFAWKKWLSITILTPILLFALYIFIMLNWSYSVGERAGYVQKFSKKGWISKTWEGEIAMVNLPGTMPEKFLFTVRDDGVAGRINQALGKRVVLSYEEHVGIPTTLFGDTQYFVTDVRVIE